MERRTRIALVLAGILLGVVLSPVGGAAVSMVLDGYYETSPDVPYGVDGGPTAILGEQAEVANGNPAATGDVLLNTSKGSIEFSSATDTSARVTQISGTWTHLDQMDVSGSELEINPEDKRAIAIEGGATSLSFTEMAVDDGTTDLTYASSGTSTITVQASGSEGDTVAFVDQSTDEVLGYGTVGSSGELTATVDSGTYDVQLQTSDGPPNVDRDSADPVGEQSTPPTELAVNVSDPDFPAEATVEFYLNGTQIDTQTISSEQRVSTSIGSLSPGQHTWEVHVTDSYGETTEATFEFATPDEIRIWNESDPDALIDDREVTSTFSTEDGDVFIRNTTNGMIDMEGLPADEELVVDLEADGYITRTVIIQSLSQQQDFYMLSSNESNVDTVQVRFVLDDVTGDYPSDESKLYVQKPLTKDGSTVYRTVTASQFGVNGFTPDLESDQRYRLIVENEENDRRVLGSYTTSVSETVELQIGEIVLDDFEGEGDYKWNAEYTNETQPQIEFEWEDPREETDELTVRIFEYDNESNQIFEETYFGPMGEFSLTEPIDQNQSKKTWVVEWEAERNGETVTGKQIVGEQRDTLTNVDPRWKTFAAVTMIVIFGGLLGAVNPAIGAVSVSLFGGIFWWIKWLPGSVTGGMILLALLVAVLFTMRSRGP